MKNAVFGRLVELKGRMRARIKKTMPEKLVKIIEKRNMADRVCFLRNRFSMRGVGNILVCHILIYQENLKIFLQAQNISPAAYATTQAQIATVSRLFFL